LTSEKIWEPTPSLLVASFSPSATGSVAPKMPVSPTAPLTVESTGLVMSSPPMLKVSRVFQHIVCIYLYDLPEDWRLTGAASAEVKSREAIVTLLAYFILPVTCIGSVV